jgi:hypothetical protein
MKADLYLLDFQKMAIHGGWEKADSKMVHRLAKINNSRAFWVQGLNYLNRINVFQLWLSRIFCNSNRERAGLISECYLGGGTLVPNI